MVKYEILCEQAELEIFVEELVTMPKLFPDFWTPERVAER